MSTNSTDTLPPDCLREALSGVYDERRFKLGDMEDVIVLGFGVLGFWGFCGFWGFGVGLRAVIPFSS